MGQGVEHPFPILPRISMWVGRAVGTCVVSVIMVSYTKPLIVASGYVHVSQTRHDELLVWLVQMHTWCSDGACYCLVSCKGRIGVPSCSCIGSNTHLMQRWHSCLGNGPLAEALVAVV